MRRLQRHLGCFAVLLAGLALPPVSAAQEKCGAARDLVVQALERAGPQSNPAAFEDALQLLKRASALCAEQGDPWYYRSLVEEHLGHAPLAKYAADKARLLGSDAQNQNVQPFILATPVAGGRRGLSASRKPDAEPPPGAESPAVAGAVKQKWALVIGVSRFADRNIPKLNYTTADALSFASLLADPAVGRFPKANVHTLTDAQATTQKIKEEINWISRHAGPDDIVVLYLATHGSPRKLDSVGGLNYLITYDTQVRNIDQPDEDALYSTAMPMQELSTAVATRMRALRTLVVLDTCYSGGSLKDTGKDAGRMMGSGMANASPSPESLQRMSEGSGRIVFAASRVDQESLESDTLQHGYFTYFLLKSLRESKGLKPLTEVFASVQQQVADKVAADHSTGSIHQNPVMDRSSSDADFALGTPSAPASARTAPAANRSFELAQAKP